MSIASRYGLTKGTDPTAPAAGKLSLFADLNGTLKIKDENGNVYSIQTLLSDTSGHAFPQYIAPTMLTTTRTSVTIGAVADQAVIWGVHLPIGAKVNQVNLGINTAAPASPSGSIGIYSIDGQVKHLGLDDLDWTVSGTKQHSFSELILASAWYLFWFGVVSTTTAWDAWTTINSSEYPLYQFLGAGGAGQTTPATITPPTGLGNGTRIPILGFSHTDLV